MSKTVSVAMATYNGGRFLREQLDSLYRQTHLPDEVVVTDDCSTDDTVHILEEYHKKYGLKYYINEHSLGVNANFYKAISLCTSDYTAICDQDDIWFDNKIEITYNKLCEIDNNTPCVVSSQAINIRADGMIIYNRKEISDSWSYKDTIIGRGNSQGCSLMFNSVLKKLVLEQCTSVPFIYDIVISQVAAILGIKYNLGSNLMYYRHHDKNVIGKYKIDRRSLIEKICDRIKNEDRLSGFIPDTRYKLLILLYEKFRGCIKNNDVAGLLEAIKYIDEHNFYQGVQRLFMLKEITFSSKIKIILKSSMINLLRLSYTPIR